MNVIDDFEYIENTTYDYSGTDTDSTVNRWLDDFGWV